MMVTLGITKAITNLDQVHTTFNLSPVDDVKFFWEWRIDLPAITDAECTALDRLRDRDY